MVTIRSWGARQLRVPWHCGTTAHVPSIYPFVAEEGLGTRGVYMGTNVLTGGGGFAFDPFEAYAAGIVTNPNVLVAGEPGMGKSSVVKTFLSRSIAVHGRGHSEPEHVGEGGGHAGRWIAIADPKGEYGPLARHLGLEVVRLHPGGVDRVNPLDAGTASAHPDEAHRRRTDVVGALCAAVLKRELHPIEDAAVGWALDAVAARPDPTLADVAAVLAHPPAEVAARAHLQPMQLARAVDAVTFGLGKLLDRSLRGMFDGRTTVRPDWTRGGLVLDLSAVHHDPHALGLVLLAATGWLQSALIQPHGPRRIQVLDEAWALLGSERTSRYLQACWKLSRAYGVANVLVVHRLSDLRAQADDGTSAAKVSAGLLADTQTRVLLRQSPDQVHDAHTLLGLTDRESELLTRLVRGRALWKVAGRTAVVQHTIGPGERALCDTDAAMIG